MERKGTRKEKGWNEECKNWIKKTTLETRKIKLGLTDEICRTGKVRNLKPEQCDQIWQIFAG